MGQFEEKTKKKTKTKMTKWLVLGSIEGGGGVGELATSHK